MQNEFFDIFIMLDYFKIIVISQITEIVIQLNFSFGMWVSWIIKYIKISWKIFFEFQSHTATRSFCSQRHFSCF